MDDRTGGGKEDFESTFAPTKTADTRTDCRESGLNSDTSRLRAKTLTRKDIEARSLLHEHPEQRVFEYGDYISMMLPEDARLKYLGVSATVRSALINGLQGVKRWQNSPRVINPEFKENDLGHVVELLLWCNTIEQDYPNLYDEISGGKRENWIDLLTMIVVHDVGEIATGDIVVPNQDSGYGRRMKKIEPRAGRMFIYKALPRAEAKKIIQIYDRFEEPANDDKVALLARAMDKGQASANVGRNIVAYNAEDSDYAAHEFVSSQSDTFEYVERLMGLLSSSEAREQLGIFFQDHVASHYDCLEFDNVDVLKQTVRQKFPATFLLKS